MLDLLPLATILLWLGALLILQEGWTLGATPSAVRPAKNSAIIVDRSAPAAGANSMAGLNGEIR
jgi:hypothetical protein